MARQLPIVQDVASTIQASLGIAAFLLCSFALFMCASHSWKRRNWRRCYGFSSDEPVIQLNTEGAFIMSKRAQQVQPGYGEESMAGQQDVCVWQKNILMGEKCQVPDFSGIIVYDSAGNIVVPPARTCAAISFK
ncbi:uncharacterized protein LOC122667417 [Telopea speciosissima]|uniref:uncharacterized protein LOC122667417 n=1 Tax=Telopea speciosissima TaxID=54955 RepID=UPI001CC6BB21|nr:uncharacterized protein LOC122667417 [Telopea speciosissima]